MVRRKAGNGKVTQPLTRSPDPSPSNSNSLSHSLPRLRRTQYTYIQPASLATPTAGFPVPRVYVNTATPPLQPDSVGLRLAGPGWEREKAWMARRCLPAATALTQPSSSPRALRSMARPICQSDTHSSTLGNMALTEVQIGRSICPRTVARMPGLQW